MLKLNGTMLAIEVTAFAGGAALARHALQLTETRWQIGAWSILAGVYAMAQQREDAKLRLVRIVMLTGAAAAGAIAMKAHLEPSNFRGDMHAARHLIRKTVDQ